VPWLTPIILATQEAEIWRIEVQSQSGQIVQETLSQKHLTEKKGWWMVQGLGPEFKSQYSKKKKKKKRALSSSECVGGNMEKQSRMTGPGWRKHAKM
jgi:hypothetical protein